MICTYDTCTMTENVRTTSRVALEMCKWHRKTGETRRRYPENE